MKHLNYQTETFTLHVEVQDVLTQNDKDLITVLFKTLVDETATAEVEVKIVHPPSTTMFKIHEKDVREQVLRTLIEKNLEVSCKDGVCRLPRTVGEIPPNLLLKSSVTYKKARQKLYYLLKKKA